MISVEVHVDTSRFDRMLSDMPAAMARAREQALLDIGAEVVSRANRAFKTESLRPSPWAPRKHNYPHQILQKSGAMKKGIGAKLRGTDTVVVGTPAEYAGYHQFGTKRMPARPFFPIDKNGQLVPGMERKIQRVIEKDFMEELGKLLGQ